MTSPFKIDDEEAVKQFFRHNKLEYRKDSFIYEFEGNSWYVPEKLLKEKNCLHIYENVYRLQKLKLLDKKE